VHEKWLEEEIEQGKLCATQLMVFSHHPWFIEHADEEEEENGKESEDNIEKIQDGRGYQKPRIR
jgi:hypothetical protein